MSEHDDHPHHISTVAVTGSYNGGRLDGLSFMFWVPPDLDLTDMRVSLPREDGRRDLYLYDKQPDPASLEAGFRYLGVVNGPA